jgi:hypothetical protein
MSDPTTTIKRPSSPPEVVPASDFKALTMKFKSSLAQQQEVQTSAVPNDIAALPSVKSLRQTFAVPAGKSSRSNSVERKAEEPLRITRKDSTDKDVKKEVAATRIDSVEKDIGGASSVVKKDKDGLSVTMKEKEKPVKEKEALLSLSSTMKIKDKPLVIEKKEKPKSDLERLLKQDEERLKKTDALHTSVKKEKPSPDLERLLKQDEERLKPIEFLSSAVKKEKPSSDLEKLLKKDEERIKPIEALPSSVKKEKPMSDLERLLKLDEERLKQNILDSNILLSKNQDIHQKSESKSDALASTLKIDPKASSSKQLNSNFLSDPQEKPSAKKYDSKGADLVEQKKIQDASEKKKILTESSSEEKNDLQASYADLKNAQSISLKNETVENSSKTESIIEISKSEVALEKSFHSGNDNASPSLDVKLTQKEDSKEKETKIIDGNNQEITNRESSGNENFPASEIILRQVKEKSHEAQVDNNRRARSNTLDRTRSIPPPVPLIDTSPLILSESAKIFESLLASNVPNFSESLKSKNDLLESSNNLSEDSKGRKNDNSETLVSETASHDLKHVFEKEIKDDQKNLPNYDLQVGNASADTENKVTSSSAPLIDTSHLSLSESAKVLEAYIAANSLVDSSKEKVQTHLSQNETFDHSLKTDLLQTRLSVERVTLQHLSSSNTSDLNQESLTDPSLNLADLDSTEKVNLQAEAALDTDTDALEIARYLVAKEIPHMETLNDTAFQDSSSLDLIENLPALEIMHDKKDSGLFFAQDILESKQNLEVENEQSIRPTLHIDTLSGHDVLPPVPPTPDADTLFNLTLPPLATSPLINECLVSSSQEQEIFASIYDDSDPILNSAKMILEIDAAFESEKNELEIARYLIDKEMPHSEALQDAKHESPPDVEPAQDVSDIHGVNNFEAESAEKLYLNEVVPDEKQEGLFKFPVFGGDMNITVPPISQDELPPLPNEELSSSLPIEIPDIPNVEPTPEFLANWAHLKAVADATRGTRNVSKMKPARFQPKSLIRLSLAVKAFEEKYVDESANSVSQRLETSPSLSESESKSDVSPVDVKSRTSRTGEDSVKKVKGRHSRNLSKTVLDAIDLDNMQTQDIVPISAPDALNSLQTLGIGHLVGEIYDAATVAEEDNFSGTKKLLELKPAAVESTDFSKLELKRSLVRDELLSTEKTYIQGLKILIQKFANPLKTTEKAKIGLTTQQISNIFLNVEALSQFHFRLCAELQDKQRTVGDIFKKYADFLKMYTQYLNGYESSMSVINSLNNNKQFKKFLESRRKDPEISLDFMSYLIMPVQRIPRYELLLKEFLKNTPNDHPEHSTLAEAFSKVQSIAQFINESKRRMESMSKVLDIQNQIEGNLGAPLMAPHRRLIKEGKVQVERSSLLSYTFRKRLIFLFNDSILTLNEDHAFKEWIMIESKNFAVSAVREPRSSCYAFSISSNDQVYTYYSQSSSMRDEWVSLIQATQEAYIEVLLQAAKARSRASILEEDVITDQQQHQQ